MRTVLPDDWAASKGIDRKKVEDMYNSFAISSKINRAKTEAQQYNVQSVPMIVVDGKFMTATDKVGSHANLPSAINALVGIMRANAFAVIVGALDGELFASHVPVVVDDSAALIAAGLRELGPNAIEAANATGADQYVTEEARS